MRAVAGRVLEVKCLDPRTSADYYLPHWQGCSFCFRTSFPVPKPPPWPVFLRLPLRQSLSIWGYKWNPLSSRWNPQVITCGANMGWGTERPGEEFGLALFILENPLSKAVLLNHVGEGREGGTGELPLCEAVAAGNRDFTEQLSQLSIGWKSNQP